MVDSIKNNLSSKSKYLSNKLKYLKLKKNYNAKFDTPIYYNSKNSNSKNLDNNIKNIKNNDYNTTNYVTNINSRNSVTDYNYFMRYISNIFFDDIENNDHTENISKRLLYSLFNSLNNKNFTNISQEIQKYIDMYTQNFKCNKETWIECNTKCSNYLKELLDSEINSTAYMLRVLQHSILSNNESNNETNNISLLVTDINKINGVWSNDMNYLILKSYGDEIGNINNKTLRKGKLIMGFGPSASGKTYWAQNIINLFSKDKNNYPNSFISIDGGIYREKCEIYYYIKESFKGCHKGFSNLVSSKFNNKSLFDSNIIKKSFIKFLLLNKNYIRINLYVPTTLSNCFSIQCDSIVKPFINLTNDKQWIGLLIWQHKYGRECNYDNPIYKCYGCTESGKEREIKEGKKYSNTSWVNSYENGLAMIYRAPGGSYKIHNAGKQTYKGHKCVSVIEDYSYNNEIIQGIFTQYANELGYEYIKYKR